jgi:DNA-binding NarL/FixJ family response regulator
MEDNWILLIDDDTNLVCAAADLIEAASREIGAKFEVCTSTHELPQLYEKLAKSRVILAVLDLWLINKETNVPDHDGGIKVFHELRQRWPQSYIIVLSAHLNEETRAKLDDYQNIAIVEKPVAIWEISDIIIKVGKELLKKA